MPPLPPLLLFVHPVVCRMQPSWTIAARAGQCYAAAAGMAASTVRSRYARPRLETPNTIAQIPTSHTSVISPSPGRGDEQRAEHDRGHAAECHPELAFELAPEGDGRDDLEGARRDRPEGHEVQQRQGRQAWPHEGGDADDDAEDAHDPHGPGVAPRLCVAASERDEQRDAIDEDVGAEQEDEHRERPSPAR